MENRNQVLKNTVFSKTIRIVPYLLPEEVQIRTMAKENYAVAEEGSVMVGVCTVITEELKKEGLARDLVRRIQNLRKAAGFNIADLIKLYYDAAPKFTEVFITHEDYITAETLSTSIYRAKPPPEAYTANFKINGESIKIGLVQKKIINVNH